MQFAQGHYTEGAELIDSVLDVVRKEAEGERVQVTLYQKVAHMTCLPSRLDIYKGHMLDKVGITVYLINIGIQAVQ